ncbi:MAG: hypothetical protein R3F59_28295 [Myxococcota bacterium]
MRHLLDHGRMPEVVLENWTEALLGRAEAIVALFRPDWPSTRRRPLILSMMHLVVRLSLEDRGQLGQMTGIGVEALEEELVEWLSGMLLRELGG